MRTILLALALSACVTEDTLDDHDGWDDTQDSEDGKSDAAVRVKHRFEDRRLFAEGGAFDPMERAFYVGSLEHGSLTKVEADGTESVFFPGTGEPGRLTLGMQVDAVRRLLWVCTTKDSLGRIWIFDLGTGDRMADIDLKAANPVASCNDVLLTDDGGALVSDRENPFIYKVDDLGRVSVWANHPLLDGRIVSLNSLDFTEDKSAVITAPYLPAKLVRISVANPRDVREVELSGDGFHDGHNLLNGPDDLVMHDGQLIVAFGSTIKRITPTDASWTRATVKSTRSIGGVTALIETDDQLYAVNGQSVRFALKIPPQAFLIFEVGQLR